MYARSFLRPLGHARTIVSDCRAARSVDNDDAWKTVSTVHNAACDLVDLCAEAVPLPPLEHVPPEEADDVVGATIERQYTKLSSNITQMTNDGGNRGELVGVSLDGSASAVDADEDRVQSVDGRTFIPLKQSGPAAANWYVLYDILPVYSTAVATDCRILGERQSLEGETCVAEEWTAVANLLSDLSRLIEYHNAIARWIYFPDRETIEYAEHTHQVAIRLNGETKELR